VSARSAATVVSGTTITSAWGNLVRDHLVTYTGSDDVSVTGQMAVNTSTGRLMIYDGSAALRLANYTAAGRTWVRLTNSGFAQGTGVNSTFSWTTEVADADSWYSGGTNVTVPSGFDGVYVVTFIAISDTAMSGGGTASMAIAGTTYVGYCATGNTTSNITVVVALAAGDTIVCRHYNGHSGAVNTNGALTIVRLCR
jgi:hypothetical protein